MYSIKKSKHVIMVTAISSYMAIAGGISYHTKNSILFNETKKNTISSMIDEVIEQIDNEAQESKYSELFKTVSTNLTHYKIGTKYTIKGIEYKPKFRREYNKSGEASWYGKDFHGKHTANGDIFDMGLLTAAHKTLPLPSIVSVTNIENGKNIKVIVNDRGPFHGDRIIDLSKKAADVLGFKNKGVAKVNVEYLHDETEEFLKQNGLFKQYKKRVIEKNI